MLSLPAALAPMASYRQFIVYILSPSQTRPGKNDKFPCDYRTGQVANAHDATIWTDVATAIATSQVLGPAYGVGFVLTDNDPFWVLDIDNCLVQDATTGAWDWSPLAKQLMAAFPGAAVEVSSSGKGLHIFGTGHMPPHSSKNIGYGLELYNRARFIAFGDKGATGDASTDFTHLLPALVSQFFPPKGDAVGVAVDWTDTARDDWNGPDNDDDLIRRMMRSQSGSAAFGTRASFADLWTGNADVLRLAYPNDTGPYDASSADRALCQHLAFWTGCNCERMLRLMKQSALVRDKWEREDYLPRTILSAVAQQRDILTDREPEPLPDTPALSSDAPAAVMVTGNTYLTIAQQVDLFKGCVYITDINRVLVPGGLLLKAEQFRVMYGGYSFPMDNANERTSRDAYEAFTQNQAFRSPRADGTCFRPDLPPASIVRDAGRARANVYWPIEIPRQVGDPGPFLRHIEKLLPDARDREIVLSYMCACVQHKGVKFQWAPLLQGVEGNGKTFLTRCVAEAIGKRYVHWPKASKLSAQFNAWMLNKLFYGVEDIYVAGSRLDVINELKPMITGQDLEIEGKGVDQVSADICGNFMFNSNHRDAILKTRNDRRFAVFYTAQQNEADLTRDGMTSAYFNELYNWLKAGGYAIVSELLYTRPIPDELNPATGCQRAPLTTSTEDAINESRGGIEQEIMEAIEQGLPGFRGGWVSSTMLGRLLDDMNASRRLPHNRRRDLMAGLGYVYHPGLADGRLNNMVLPDGNKPRLFITKDHAARGLTVAAEIARAYTQAQGVGPQ